MYNCTDPPKRPFSVVSSASQLDQERLRLYTCIPFSGERMKVGSVCNVFVDDNRSGVRVVVLILLKISAKGTDNGTCSIGNGEHTTGLRAYSPACYKRLVLIFRDIVLLVAAKNVFAT